MAAAFEQTPVCEATGLPLPILPLGPRENGALFVAGKSNEHHHFHPAKSPLLEGVAGAALRGCRVQLVNRGLHDNYHRIFTGSELPSLEEEIFRLTVLSAAGVVPLRALELSKRWTWREVNVTPQQHQYLSKPGITSVDKPGNLAKFFADYAARQQIESVIDNRVIDEFLHTNTTRSRKQELGRQMLSLALGMSLEPINNTQMNLRSGGYIEGRKPETFHRVTKRLIRQHALNYFTDGLSQRLVTI